MICLCLTGSSLDEWTGQLQRNRQWISMVELRIDLLRPAERSVESIREWWARQRGELPGILTIRRLQDYGSWEGDDGQRLFLFSRLVSALEPEYIDVELDRSTQPDWVQLGRRQEASGGQVIRSFHGAVSNQEEIAQLMARLAAGSREIPKLAIESNTLLDTTNLLLAAREFQRRMPGRTAVWIAMGEYGLPTRVAPWHFGSSWTYASDPAGTPAASGQITPQVLAHTYRAGTVDDMRPVFAVVGSPIAHSKSPEYHNRRFQEEGVSALYIPVRADTFGAFLAFANALPIVGASVTVPHKTAALRAAVEDLGESGAVESGASAEAQAVGAANTLVRDAHGRWWADNTDVEGLMAPLTEIAGAGTGRRAAVIGAGGAARAAVVGLRDHGWHVEVYNRTEQRAHDLAVELGLDSTAAHPLTDLTRLPAGSLDLIVQTTPVGMSHSVEGDPSHGYPFGGTEIVYDVIYTPAETAFIRRAAAAGCTTINGERMFA
ncbi:MAG TPA: type I 3-dehydroquinate dehydratase, partial [Alkalispirochaeta sp.]|nr:type I 3-dehydroquinate dehydratase [Alkalispirochaeta sp.]